MASSPSLPRITFVSGNQNKIREVKEILAGVVEIDAAKIDLPELQGEVLDIAREKAVLAFSQLQRPCMTEDTSLCFHGLGDLPGPYIKWFFDKLGNEGLNKMLAAFDDKTGHALCVFTVATSTRTQDCQLYIGRCEGRIVSPRGPSGFGWDPLFEPQGYAQTFAEMDAETKNSISHRKRALDALVAHYRHPPQQDSDEATGTKRSRD